jgi:hypothetical protein
MLVEEALDLSGRVFLSLGGHHDVVVIIVADAII